MSTPRFTGRNAAENYLAWIVADAERAVEQARAEGQALRGELGVERQIAAMGVEYLRLKDMGQHVAAAALKAEAYAVRAAAIEEQGI